MLIRDLQTYQQTPYAIIPVPEVQSQLKSMDPVVSEEESYRKSLVLEPRAKAN
jgi:hypothetical protein